MKDNLYETAKQNLKYKRRSGIFAFVGVVLFILWFSFWLRVDQSVSWAWLFVGPLILLSFFLAYRNGQKIIGKRDPVLEEMNRLKNHAEPVLDLNELENIELPEKEITYRKDDFV